MEATSMGVQPMMFFLGWGINGAGGSNMITKSIH